MCKINHNFYWVLVSIILFFSCSGKVQSFYEGKDFREIIEIANLNKQGFCVVLTDSSQELSKEYLQLLKNDYSYLAQKSIFNIVDLSSNKSESFIKILTPLSLPLTCVFSQEGQLVDLIPGTTKESFLYTDQAIDSKSVTEYHWPNRFGKNKKEILPILRQAFDLQLVSDGLRVHPIDVAMITDSVEHPFLYYLLLKSSVGNKDSTTVLKYAKNLIALESSTVLELYKNEFIEAKKIINPGFSVENAPNIKLANEEIKLPDLKVGKSYPFIIKIYNEGQEPLRIEKISVSCTCVSIDGLDEGIVVLGGNSYSAQFHFKPENEGEIFRDIFIHSNALNRPSLHVKVIADATQ